jgi:hypothetical protein
MKGDSHPSGKLRPNFRKAPMDDKVVSLASADGWWGNFLLISTLVVLVGVIGEAAVDLTRLLDSRP